MEKKIDFNYESLKYKYFPLGIDKDKVLALKLSIDCTEISELDITNGKETLFKLEQKVSDWNPIAMYNYDDYFIVIGQSFFNEVRVCKYNKKERKELVYNYLKGNVESLYCEKIGSNLYISVLEEKARIYNYDAETNTLSLCNESDEDYIFYMKKINKNLILTHEISLKNRHKQSSIYDGKWNRVETIKYNSNSDDLCYAQDTTHNFKIVVSNVLGSNKLFLDKDKQIENIDICSNLDKFEIEDYIYDKGIIIYKTESALTYTLNIYNIYTGMKKEIIYDEFIYDAKAIDNKIVVIGSSVHSKLIVTIYDIENDEIINEYNYLKYQTQNINIEKKCIEVNERKVDYIKYLPCDYKDIKGYVIYLHGGPESHWIPRWDEVFYQLQKNNFAIIYPNYFGSSQCGSIDYSKEENKWGIKDVEEILYIRKIINHKNVILMGESYGSYLAMKVWNMNPNDWAGVIAYSAFYTPWSLYENGSIAVKKTVRKHISANDIGCNDMIPCLTTKKVFTKIYLLHGKCDERIPYTQSINILEYLNRSYICNNIPNIELIDGLGHEIHNISKSFEVNSCICRAIKEIIE